MGFVPGKILDMSVALIMSISILGVPPNSSIRAIGMF